MKRKFDSDLEKSEHPLMAALGITRAVGHLGIFRDATGTTFGRDADWDVKRKRWSCHLETKATLNNQPDKATADRAANNRHPDRSEVIHIAMTTWSNSAACAAIVHTALGADNYVIVLPDEVFKLGVRGERKGKLSKIAVKTLGLLAANNLPYLRTSQLQSYIGMRDIVAIWQEHNPLPPEPQPLAERIEVFYRTPEALEAGLRDIKAAGYHLQRGTKTATSAKLFLPRP